MLSFDVEQVVEKESLFSYKLGTQTWRPHRERSFFRGCPYAPDFDFTRAACDTWCNAESMILLLHFIVIIST